ncbi:plasmid-related protein [Pseudomonas sp. NC02]|uniref:plasmid-related protein n=1 Tax=Pseudomonas sp. NC02 TaxID=2067572 RepID=UPI000C867A78|nr:plasmid-related protein [Pseudomonas sp. NC02]AUO25925.1 plasmid-related protein [Pseudomonas sp. NC02]
MNTEAYLVGKFGALMQLSDLAELLGRSTDGLRVSLYSDTDLSRKIKPTMIRIGRRIYFRTQQVNVVLQLEAPKNETHVQ